MLRTLDLRGTGSSALTDLPRPNLGEEGPIAEVRAILAQVREQGDQALYELTKRFDGVEARFDRRAEIDLGEST